MLYYDKLWKACSLHVLDCINPSLSGISSLRSDIPPRLRRGVAKHKEKMAFK